ncbi:MAG TPA: glycosyltransferase family 2 protein, partial [Acidimicrobiales bacterium]|nr:glycosyltransferase family 2 protein [Acidimicrobiales bacterium]
FTDDDCRPAAEWVTAMSDAVGPATAAAGPTRNGRPRDVYAAASQAITNHLVAASLDSATGHVGFAPTSNLACPAALHRSLPFDEGFPLAAGEDREWCARLASSGGVLVFVAHAEVAHHQDLGWRGFWRQQQRYGRGAYAVHRSAPRGDRLQGPGFYLGLLRAGFRAGPVAGLLVIVAQAATAVGLARAALADRR